MKILSNKKYNDLILKSCRGMFGAVTDDMLLRNCGAMQQEIDNYKNILVELEDTLKRRINAYEERQNQGIDLTEVMTIRLASDKDTLDKIQELKEKYK